MLREKTYYQLHFTIIFVRILKLKDKYPLFLMYSILWTSVFLCFCLFKRRWDAFTGIDEGGEVQLSDGIQISWIPQDKWGEEGVLKCTYPVWSHELRVTLLLYNTPFPSQNDAKSALHPVLCHNDILALTHLMQEDMIEFVNKFWKHNGNNMTGYFNNVIK
jgi:hypothetical protein